MKKTMRDLDVSEKRVLVRVDFNVPLKGRMVRDDTRIRFAMPTIQYLMDQKARIILCSHLGRPKGKVVQELRLDPVSNRLTELLGSKVTKLDDCIGTDVESALKKMGPGEVLLLENTRFHPEEEKNDPEFAKKLANLADIFVNDAFGAAHRAHGSTEGVAHFLPSVAGFLMEKELEALRRAIETPENPFVAILGGVKISDKIGAIERLLERVDILLVGGGMANTFFKALGLEVGQSLVEKDSLDIAAQISDKAGGRLILPVDVVVADALAEDANTKILSVDRVPADWKILDIGPQTVDLFKEKLAPAKMVIWNGPLGAFETDPFAEGTIAVARILAELDAATIIGGGDSVAAVIQAGMEDKMTHLSTGGGAFLEYIEGKELPGISILEDR